MTKNLESLAGELFSESTPSKKMLYHLYDSGPKTSKLLENELGISKATAYRIIKDFKRDGALVGQKTKLLYSSKLRCWELKAFDRVIHTYRPGDQPSGGKIPIAYDLSEPYNGIVSHMKEIDRLVVEARNRAAYVAERRVSALSRQQRI
jgi:hypothetical protein